jgi:hypothetical protein
MGKYGKTIQGNTWKNDTGEPGRKYKGTRRRTLQKQPHKRNTEKNIGEKYNYYAYFFI